MAWIGIAVLLSFAVILFLGPQAGAQPYPGYTSGVPQESAAPILEGVCMLASTNPCSPEARCYLSAPVVGEALCRCPNGYEGTGRMDSGGCRNIDECKLPNRCDPRNQECVDTPGDYECRCKRGYTLAPDNKTCLDVNECSNANLNSCDGVTSYCFNLEGSYECRCMNERMIVDEVTGKCRDMNECVDKGGIMNPCEHAELCLNMKPGVECGCREGFELAADGQSCLDIDECQVGTHTCNIYGKDGARCENTDGSYKCDCQMDKGWIANLSDARQCDNLNECRHQPYICGGQDSCCGDLMPPDKFACMLPLSATAVANMQMAQTRQAYPGGSSSLVDPMSGLENGTPDRVPVGPAADSLLSAAAAYRDSQVSSGPQGQSIPAHNTPTRDPAAELEIQQLKNQIQQQQVEQLELLQEQLKVLQSQSGAGMRSSDFKEPACFSDNSQYQSKPIPGGVFQIGSISACQSRCADIGDCRFFSFNTSSSGCRLFPFKELLTQSPGWTSGPRVCGSEDDEPLLSGQGFVKESEEKSNSTLKAAMEIRKMGRTVFDVLSELLQTDLSSSTLTSDALAVLRKSDDFVFVVAGDTPQAEVPGVLLSEAKERVREMVEQSELFSKEEIVQLIPDNILASLRLILDETETVGDQLLDSIGKPLLKGSTEPKNMSEDRRLIGYETNRTPYVENIVRRLQRSILRGGLREKLPSVRGISGVGSLLNDDAGQCPPGFNHAQDLYRAKLRDSAVKTLQSAIRGSTDVDGFQNPGITPDGFTNGVVRNANDLASAMTAWYTEIAQVPGEVFQAGNNYLAATDPTPAFQAVAAEAGIPPGAVTSAEILAASLGTGLIVGGASKMIYGKGPGDSKIMDRTGMSKKMIYDF